MPDVVDTNNPIQGMLSHAAMMSARRKAQKLSAYDPDPKRGAGCRVRRFEEGYTYQIKERV